MAGEVEQNHTATGQGNQPVAVEWGGCRLTDESPREEIEALAGQEFLYCGRAGIAESITLIEGDPPWGEDYSRPRPVYSVVWRSLDG